MEVSPLRALTPFITSFLASLMFVEMEVSPLRALTHFFFILSALFIMSRNGSKPVEGIDTSLVKRNLFVFCKVEMEVSPLRALTRFALSSLRATLLVEMEVSLLRALTQCLKHFFDKCFFGTLPGSDSMKYN